MIILYIPNIEIPTDIGYVHTHTDWMIATSPLFRDADIVKQSLSDDVHLTSITMDVDVAPGTMLYARARVICNIAIFEWSNIDVINVEDFVNVSFEYPIPSKVIKPLLTLDFDKSNFPTTMFTIDTGNMHSTGNADLVETTYIITDIDGTPYYFDATRDNVTKKLVNEVVLPEDKLYIISAAFKSSSNDVSTMASELVYVKPVPGVNIRTTIDNIDTSVDVPLAIDDINAFKSMEVVIYGAGVDVKEELFRTTQESMSIVVPKETFTDYMSSVIMIGIEVTYSDDTKSGMKYYPATILIDLNNTPS